MLNIAYIGNGKSTNRYHLPFSTKVEGINVKSIYSRSASPWEKIDEITYTNNIEDIYNDPEIELVVITTPPSSHYVLAKEALENGKNVLLEKPFTETIKEAEELFALAEQKGLIIQCYQNRRFDSDFLTIQKVIESNILGDLIEVEMNYDYFRPEVPEQAEEFKKLDSFIFTHACHTVDQVLNYFGFPKKVNYDVRSLLGENKMNDYFDLDFYYDNNLKVSVRSTYFRITPRPSFIVHGKNGVFVKEIKDIQEDQLKMFYMPDNADFGVEKPEQYGTLKYIDDNGIYHEEKVISEVGDYSRFYENLYNEFINNNQAYVKEEETLTQINILEEAISNLNK